jgi:hypothetical protein
MNGCSLFVDSDRAVIELVSGTCFVDWGYEMECIDLDEALKGGEAPKKASSFFHMGRGCNLGGRHWLQGRYPAD